VATTKAATDTLSACAEFDPKTKAAKFGNRGRVTGTVAPVPVPRSLGKIPHSATLGLDRKNGF
jgi:hypothetical protein